MPYALRDALGQIASLHREPVAGGQSLDRQHPEVLAFLGRDPDAERFASLDADLVRVLEDLIDALIRRNVLNITDLPPEAQAKLFDRKHFREGMQAHSLTLFGALTPHLGSATSVVHPDWSALADADLRLPPDSA
jgi:hypothetical protein